MPALILDCDGVLADTERDGHRPAFNATFADAGLPVRWSARDYAEKLRIGGGKERMTSLLTPDFVREASLPVDPAAQQELVSRWHQQKTAHYIALLRGGHIPPRPGVRRLIEEGLSAGWQVAVASTSATQSVQAVVEQVVGTVADQVVIFAGDVVKQKKPAPDIYLLALAELGISPAEAVVIEDSAIGLTAARDAGLRTLITVSGYTATEDFRGAALVLSSLGDEREPAQVLADPYNIRPGKSIHLADLLTVLNNAANQQGGRVVQAIDLDDIEFAVRSITKTVIVNEREFGELDSVVGDGDFGFSLARGFEAVDEAWDGYTRDDIGRFLQAVALTLSSRIGGTSGPIWGTAFLRAALTVKGETTIDTADVVSMLSAAIDGIKARGHAEVGDKTLLDVLVPMTSAVQQADVAGQGGLLRLAARTARQAAEDTRALQARRGRAAYAGERSVGVIDAGAGAIAVIVERMANENDQRANVTATVGSEDQ